MDPVALDTRNSSCNEILSTANKLATIFRNAAGLYSDLAPTFTKFSDSCTTFSEAVQAIQSWLTAGHEKQLLDSTPWYQLTTSLGRAEKVISVLQDEVQSILRSRYESRSRSRISTDWDLEGMQSAEEDVQHETGTLQQILQYMRLLEVSSVSSRAQTEPREVAEGQDAPRGSTAIMASIAGGSQAGTDATLDKPAPPYHLVDVRSKETHTKWHPDQSVVAVDHATPESPSVTDDTVEHLISGARSLSISTSDLAINLPEPIISDGHWPVSGVRNWMKKNVHVFIHDKVYNVSSFIDEHPGGEQVLLDLAGEDATEAFEDVGHSDEAHKLLDGLLLGESTEMSVAVPRPLESSTYQFRKDNLERRYNAIWPWHPDGIHFSVMDIGKDLPTPHRQVLDDLNISINFLYVLLTKIWPHCEGVDTSSVLQLFFEMDALWKLSMSLGLALRNSDMGTPQNADVFFYARSSVEDFGDCVRTLDDIAHDAGLSASMKPASVVAASAFTTTIQNEHSMQLTDLTQNLASLNLWLQLRSLDS